MFRDLSPEDNDAKSRIILEHELRAAIRIIGYFVEQHGGKIEIPHRILGTDYRVSVRSSATSNVIGLESRVQDGPATRV